MEQNHTNQIKKLTGTQENVIVGAVAVLLTVFLFVFVGWDGLKDWFSKPLIWHDPDGITAEAQLKEETDDEIQLLIYIDSGFHKRITSYHMDIICGSAVYTIQKTYPGEGEYLIAKRICVKKDGPDAAFYKALSGKDVEDIHLKIHVRELYSGDKKLVKQTGLVKIIGLAVVSVVSGLLVTMANIKNQWLRLLLKLLCVPSLVLLFAVIVLISFAGSSDSSVKTGRSAADANARNRAAEEYKRQSGYKAGAVMTGRPQDAARAQRDMDRAMADMLVPGGSQTDSARKRAAEEYKRQAGHKAGAAIHGNRENAARAQGQMDKAFADMIAANNSQAKKEYQKWAQHKANAEMRGKQRDAAFAQRQMDRYMADMLQGK